MADAYLEVLSFLGKRIRITKTYWEFLISVKHPTMAGKEELVRDALRQPDEIRKSRKDRTVFLYYRSLRKNFIAVVCKHLNGDGYIITAYITDKIKIGEKLWGRQG